VTTPPAARSRIAAGLETELAETAGSPTKRVPERSVPRWLTPLLLAAPLSVAAPEARAWVHEGQTAPNFTKVVFGTNPAVSRSLTDYAGKVVVIFLLGCT
jgi:hypothetical protein